jgi:hypothetical protein
VISVIVVQTFSMAPRDRLRCLCSWSRFVSVSILR